MAKTRLNPMQVQVSVSFSTSRYGDTLASTYIHLPTNERGTLQAQEVVESARAAFIGLLTQPVVMDYVSKLQAQDDEDTRITQAEAETADA